MYWKVSKVMILKHGKRFLCFFDMSLQKNVKSHVFLDFEKKKRKKNVFSNYACNVKVVPCMVIIGWDILKVTSLSPIRVRWVFSTKTCNISETMQNRTNVVLMWTLIGRCMHVGTNINDRGRPWTAITCTLTHFDSKWWWWKCMIAVSRDLVAIVIWLLFLHL